MKPINPLDNPYATIFGLMDEVYGPGSAKALQECGGPLQAFCEDSWEPICWKPSWDSYLAYRRAPGTQDVVPWRLIKEGWDWYARSNAGNGFVFQTEPEIDYGFWNGENARCVDFLSGHEIGTVYWENSLQRRPVK